MKITRLELPEVLVIDPDVRRDDRGSFAETFRADRYAAAGIVGDYVQDNVSCSRYGVLRGLHFQQPHAQGKLVHVLRGEIFDVAVDVRLGSATFGRWVSSVLSDDNHRQMFVPRGFAHGFVVTSPDAVVSYKCSAYYAPGCEQHIRWDDPRIGIRWPVTDPILSPRDAAAPLLADLDRNRLPRIVEVSVA